MELFVTSITFMSVWVENQEDNIHSDDTRVLSVGEQRTDLGKGTGYVLSQGRSVDETSS